MAWPNTPLTTYVANSLPAIKAADLNALQAALNVIAPTAQLVGVSTPQSIYVDSMVHNKWLIDHNGYPMGRIDEYREDWKFVIAESNSGSRQLPNSPRWAANTTAAGCAITGVAPSASYFGNYVQLGVTTNANTASLQSEGTFYPGSAVVLVAEFEAMLSAVGAQNLFWAFGFNSGSAFLSGGPVSQHAMYFYWNGNTTAHWTCQVNNGNVSPPFGIAITGHDAANVTWQRFRLEFHGSGTPYGQAANPDGGGTGGANTAKVRFFIDDVWVTTTATQPPSGLMFLDATLTGLGAATATAAFGPIRWVYNRWLSTPAL